MLPCKLISLGIGSLYIFDWLINKKLYSSCCRVIRQCAISSEANMLMSKLLQESNFRGDSCQKERPKAIPTSVEWLIWEKRSTRCFDDKSSHIQKIWLKCFILLYFGVKEQE